MDQKVKILHHMLTQILPSPKKRNIVIDQLFVWLNAVEQHRKLMVYRHDVKRQHKAEEIYFHAYDKIVEKLRQSGISP
jgi:predicted transcriptional regulator